MCFHEMQVKRVPELPISVRSLRIDRVDEDGLGAALPSGFTTVHLQGCPLPGTLDSPEELLNAVKKLVCFEDLQLPDGYHETPLT